MAKDCPERYSNCCCGRICTTATSSVRRSTPTTSATHQDGLLSATSSAACTITFATSP
jgi:hypothetical protein